MSSSSRSTAPTRATPSTRALAQGIADALDELDGDDELRVGVLTGAGKGFSAGMDLSAFVHRRAAVDRATAGSRASSQRAARKPLIAAVEGFAVAGGFEIALACDLIVAAKGARLGIPEVKRSLFAGAGGLLRLPQRMPYGIAMELALTGDPISAERGYELGLVNRLAEPGGAVDAALELAAAIAPNAPLALAATKQILQARRLDRGGVLGASRAEIAEVFGSEDAREGAKAFAEKRAPRWQGRWSTCLRSTRVRPPAIAGRAPRDPHPRAMVGPPQIVAFGGGGFSMEAGNPLLDDYVLGLTRRRAPEGLLPAHRLGRRRPLHRALLPRVLAGALRALARLAVPPRPGRRPRLRRRRAPARAGPHLRRRRQRRARCSACGARTASTRSCASAGGAASCCAG